MTETSPEPSQPHEPKPPSRRCPRCSGKGDVPDGRLRRWAEDVFQCSVIALTLMGLVFSYALLNYLVDWIPVLARWWIGR